MSALGDNLRAQRGKLGLNQEEMARELGISKFMYVKYETGRTLKPGPKTCGSSLSTSG